MSNRVVKITVSGFSIILLVSIALVSFLYLSPQPADAQTHTSSMKQLLEKVDSDIVIKFVKPVVDNEPIWRLPASISVEGEEIQILRSIDEIGDDYICVNEVAGGARRVICIPFTNIASVTYDNMN